MSTLFRSATAAGVWREHWCERCHHPDEINRRDHGVGTGCPILARAASTQRKPVEWERNARAATMDGAYRCNAFLDQPAVNRRGTTDDQTMSMFDVAPAEGRDLIPVDGWPDYQAAERKPSKGEHL